MSEAPIGGLCPPGLEPLREAFAANFAGGFELGARFSLAIEGEVALDLWGGWADRAKTKPFDQASVVPIFSTTKAVAALLIARLVGQGRLGYGQHVAEIWPAFAAAGKAEITVEQALSHQAGLCGLKEPMDPALWFDWDAICERLAAMAPLWPPGTASGYHPLTFGYLAGEIFRRIDGRTMSRALAEDIAGPLGLDLWIGLPDDQVGRLAEVVRPSTLPDLHPLTEPRRLAFLTKWAQPGGRGAEAWRHADIPSANGHATAPALARLMAALACDGAGVLAPGVAAEVMRERIAGPDLVLPREISWAAGLVRNVGSGLYGPGALTVGHSGWGGSCAFADPDRRLSGAYVMNRQSAVLIGDARPRRLINAAYAALRANA